jgi:hypothetical protein
MAGREVISKAAFWLFSLAGCCYCCSCCSCAFSIRELTTKSFSLSRLLQTYLNLIICYLECYLQYKFLFIYLFLQSVSLCFEQSNFFPKHLLYFSSTAANLSFQANALVHFLALFCLEMHIKSVSKQEKRVVSR